MSGKQVYFVLSLLGRVHFKVKGKKKPTHTKTPVLHLLLVIPYILASPISACQTNEFIRENIGMWCREWGMWHVHEGVTHSVGSALACMHACARDHVPFDYVQMCHSACLWAVTTLMGVTVIFDCRPSRWAPALTGGEKCRKSHPWIGGGGVGGVRSTQSSQFSSTRHRRWRTLYPLPI